MTEDKATATALIANIVSTIFGVFLNAYAFAYLWLWFIVPLGVPVIGMAHALGIIAIRGFLFYGYALDKHESAASATEKLWTATAKRLTVPLVSLTFGYIFHSFM
jgi:hypothetical protein